ncbi:MAG: RluA family pseudouridine synthase [Meiothermus sp.]|nr:RluA family pseudouridine synthase [Meiothermus sp.]
MKLNRGYRYRKELDSSALGHNTLSYLAAHYPHSSAPQWQERLNRGEVWLDGRAATGDEPLRPGQILDWNRPGWLEQPTPQEFGVVYQDEALLAVHKPGGLPTLPGAGFFANTLLSLVQAQFPAAIPLHRLGRATSGLVLFALNPGVASRLQQGWPLVHKQYQALGSGIAALDAYDIQAPIGKVAHPRLGWVYGALETGKPSRSVARTLERRHDSTVFEVDLHTGRPHQIRIHLAYIGHPLLGDPLYEAGGQPLEQPGLPGDAGYWLHAKRLVLQHPVSGERLEVEAELPEVLRCGGT